MVLSVLLLKEKKPMNLILVCATEIVISAKTIKSRDVHIYKEKLWYKILYC